MIALALMSALIIQTYDGQTRVVENLSEAGCEKARCLAQYGHSCEDELAVQARAMAAERKRRIYEAAHPLICPMPKGPMQVTVCHRQGEPADVIGTMIDGARSIPAGATKTAMCAK